MSSHADTIRLAINAAGAEGHLVAGAWDSLDALLAEIEEWRVLAARQLEEFTVTTAKYRDESQRLREREETVRGNLYLYSVGELEAVEAVIAIREALAGDAE